MGRLKYALAFKILLFVYSFFILANIPSVDAAVFLQPNYYPGYQSAPSGSSSGGTNASTCQSSTGYNFTCWNDSSIGSSGCGAGCAAGTTWSRFSHSFNFSWRQVGGDLFCWPQITYSSSSCSSGDKCIAGNTYLTAGYCNCSYSTAPYKYCCSATGQPEACIGSNLDGTYPNEGQCPGGYVIDGFRVRSSPCVPIATPTPCPSYGSNYRTYCSGNTLRESYNNGSCGVTDSLVQSCSGQCRTRSSVQAGCCTYSNVRCGGYDPTGSTPYAGGAGCGGAYQDVYSCFTGSSQWWDFASCSSSACIAACNNPNWCASAPTPTRTPTPFSSPPTPTRTPTPFTSGPTPTRTPTPGPGCASLGSTCGSGLPSCCSGICASGGPFGPTCQTPTTCTGCQSLNTSTNTCFDNNLNCPSGQVCSGGVCQAQTYTISGTVFIDTNENGARDCSGTCNMGPGDEPGYQGAVLQRVGPGSDPTTSTPSSGNYSFTNVPAGTYTINLTTPSGYQLTTSGSLSRTVGPSASNVNFGIVAALPTPTPTPTTPPPACSTGVTATQSTVNPGQSITLTAQSCTNVENPDDGNPPPPYGWNPTTPGDPSGPGQCTTSTIVVGSSTSTSSTATWTAPSCPTTQIICRPRVTVNGPGGNNTYSSSITVRQAGEINVFVHDVTNGEAQNPSAPLFTEETTIELSGATSSTQTITGGTYSFTCLPNGDYTVSIGVPSGYQVAGGSVSQQTSITNGVRTRDIHFYITNFEPWFQTETGDVRMRGIVNPIPAGVVGSTSSLYPGIFFSTQFNVEESEGNLSSKGWLVNREYSYNSLTQNRNGTVAYSFYKSRARQEGIPITEIESGTLTNADAEILENGVYEVNGDLVIESYSHIAQRAVLLVNGNVTINSEIDVPLGSLFILAAKGNITISEEIGEEAPFSSTESNLEGYYSAEGNIIIEGGECSGGTPDRRLNIGGALIANALKPFSSQGGGVIENNRSLCSSDDLYPSLYVSSRPDFLTALTDFYKVSYTKWREVTP